MKHSILRKLMLIAVLLTSSHAFAYDFEVDGIYYNLLNLSELTCGVTYKNNDYNSYSGDITIPETVCYKNKMLKVVSIGYEAFRDCKNLTSLIVGDSINIIDQYAFYNCCNLINISIPKSVTRIDAYAFNGCNSLKELNIEDGPDVLSLEECSYSHTYNGWTTTYVCGLFYNNPIEKVYLGRNLKYDVAPFWDSLNRNGNANIKEVIIGNSVTHIKSNIFYKCSGLNTITIGSSVTTIDNSSFSNCTSITTIYSLNSIPPTGVNFENSVYINATLYIPFRSMSLYQSAAGWKNFWDIQEALSCIESTLSNDVTVSVENGNIVINGVIDNENVGVYNVNGQCVYSGTATTIPVNTKGLYIVKVNNKTFKVML